jgi:hypothetical protein
MISMGSSWSRILVWLVTALISLGFSGHPNQTQFRLVIAFVDFIRFSGTP